MRKIFITLFIIFTGGIILIPSVSAKTNQTITVKGSFHYLDYFDTWHQLKYARIVVYEKLSSGSIIRLQTSNTSYIDGSYQVTVNTVESPPNIGVAVYATDNYSVWVGTDINNPNSVLGFSTPVWYNVSSPVIDFQARGITRYTNGAAGAFRIYDLIANKAWNYLKLSVNWDNNYNLAVEWSPSSTQNPRYQENLGMYLHSANAWEDAITLHEFGHFVERQVYGSWISASGCSWTTGTNQCAWREGWPTFLQSAIRNNSSYGGTTCDGCSVIAYGIERPTPLAQGANSPGAVAAFLWDIFDPINETCDSMENGINGQTNNGIWKIFYETHPTTILQFRNNWIGNSNGYNTQLNKLSDHHRITSLNSPCDNQYTNTYIPMISK